MAEYKYKELSEEEKGTPPDAWNISEVVEQNVREIDEQNESSEVLAQIALFYEQNKSLYPKNECIYLLLKGGLYLVAFNAGIPFFIPASKFAGNNAVLGGVFGVSIYVAIGSISIWSVRNLLNYVALIRSTSQESICSESILAACSLGLGGGSAIPGVLISLRYNPGWMIVFSSFFDITTNTVSFNKLLRQLYIDKYSYSNTKEVRHKRDHLIENLHSGVSDKEFTESNITQIIVLNELKQATEVASPKLQIQARNPAVFKYGLEISKQIVGILLPISWELFSIYLVYSDMHQKLHYNKVGSAFTAVFSTGPTYYLEYLFCKSLVSSLYCFAANKAFRVDKNPSILDYYPGTTISILFFATCLITFSFAGRAQVVLDVLAPGRLRDVALISVSTGTVVFKLSAAVANIFECGNILLSTHPVFARQLLFDTAEIVLASAKPKVVNKVLQLMAPKTEKQKMTPYPLEIDSNVPSKFDVSSKYCRTSFLSFFYRNTTKNAVEQPLDVEDASLSTEHDLDLEEVDVSERRGLLRPSFCAVS